MRPVDRTEILPIGEYEPIRPRFRARVIEQKKLRRVAVGDFMSVVFENRDTVLLQIQEMLRAERITSEPAVLHELETYNELVPGKGQLSMTLFVEIADKSEREAKLIELAGLERHVALEVDGRSYRAQGEDRSVEGLARTTAVHYMKVDVDDAGQAAMKAGKPAFLVVDHPKCPLRAELPPAVARGVAGDFDEP
ncbi:MAG: DUF3501 family protein [Polyangiaceae bacterium]|nr:DUF3501 family protein [Polyangiaceae bacterium]